MPESEICMALLDTPARCVACVLPKGHAGRHEGDGLTWVKVPLFKRPYSALERHALGITDDNALTCDGRTDAC